MKTLIFAYFVSLALALGAFQNCSPARFGTALTDSSSSQSPQSVRESVPVEPVTVGSLVIVADPPLVDRGGKTTISATLTEVTEVQYACTPIGSATKVASGILTPARPSVAVTVPFDLECTFIGTGPDLRDPVTTQPLVIRVKDPGTTPTNRVPGALTVTATPTQVTRGASTIVTAISADVTRVTYVCSPQGSIGTVVGSGGFIPTGENAFTVNVPFALTCVFTGTGPNLISPLTRSIDIGVIDAPTPPAQPNPVPSPYPVPVPVPTPYPVPVPVPTPYPVPVAQPSPNPIPNPVPVPVPTPVIVPVPTPVPVAVPTPVPTPVPVAVPTPVPMPVPTPPPVAEAPAQLWTWQGLVYQTTTNRYGNGIYDGVEWASCAGVACPAPKIQCYNATRYGQSGHPIGETQLIQPNGFACYLRQAWEGWIYR